MFVLKGPYYAAKTLNARPPVKTDQIVDMGFSLTGEENVGKNERQDGRTGCFGEYWIAALWWKRESITHLHHEHAHRLRTIFFTNLPTINTPPSPWHLLIGCSSNQSQFLTQPECTCEIPPSFAQLSPTKRPVQRPSSSGNMPLPPILEDLLPSGGSF